MAARKRAGSRKKGTHFASLGKKVPKGYMAFVQGSEVRITKMKKRASKKTSRKK